MCNFGFPVEMAPTAAAPFFDGKMESFADCSQGAELLTRVTNLDPTRRALPPVLHTDAAAREYCMAAGNNQLLDPEVGEESAGR